MNPHFNSIPRFGVASILLLVLVLLAGTSLARGQDDRGAALRAAASRGEVEAVRSLLAGGVGVDDANEYGATALILACMRGHADVAGVLLDADADADIADGFYGFTALGWAADNGHEDVVSLLFSRGAGGFDELFAAAVASSDAERVAELLAMNVPEADVLSAALQRAIDTQNRPLGELLMRFGAVPPPPEILDLDPEVLRRYEGVYVDEVGFELELRADPDTGALLARPTGMRNSLRFLPVDETTFIAEQSAAIFIRFTVREGRVVSMSFTQSGDTRRMTRR